MIHINGRLSQWLIQFDSNLDASAFVTTCASNGIEVVGIAHNDEETTVYFASEENQQAGALLL